MIGFNPVRPVFWGSAVATGPDDKGCNYLPRITRKHFGGFYLAAKMAGHSAYKTPFFISFLGE